MSYTDWRQVRVRTYAYRRGPAACACVGGTKSKKKEREREKVKEEEDGKNTFGEPLWKEDMMARGVMLRELLCSSGTTGP